MGNVVKTHTYKDGSLLELAQNDNGFDVTYYGPDMEDWDRYGFATRARAEEIYESCICGDPQLMQNYVETYLDEETMYQEMVANLPVGDALFWPFDSATPENYQVQIYRHSNQTVRYISRDGLVQVHFANGTNVSTTCNKLLEAVELLKPYLA